MHKVIIYGLIALACSSLSLTGCYSITQALSQPAHVSPPHASHRPQVSTDAYRPPLVLDLAALKALSAIMPRLLEYQVVFVGETHNRYDHHLNQLEIIRRLHAGHPDLVIGMEFFQQPYQPFLDAFIAGELDETSFLSKTEYFQRWGYDYRLYQPILLYARAHDIPVLALNLPQELTRKVTREGWESLTEKERTLLPAEIDRSDEAYRKRLRAIYGQHPATHAMDFDAFVDGQLLWDEGMAERIAGFLRANPDRHMVVLAGSGHLVYGSGIPNRLRRRIPVTSAVVLNDIQGEVNPNMADFLLLGQAMRLPPAGRIGVHLDTSRQGIRVAEVLEDSPAQSAGVQTGDQIVGVNEHEIDNLADLKLAMLGQRPGDIVQLEILREGWLTGEKAKMFTVQLY